MFSKKQKSNKDNENLNKSGVDQAEKLVSAEIVNDDSNNRENIRIIYDDATHESKVLYANKPFVISNKHDYYAEMQNEFIENRDSRENEGCIRATKVELEASPTQSKKVLNTIKNEIFNETYKLLGIKVEDLDEQSTPATSLNQNSNIDSKSSVQENIDNDEINNILNKKLPPKIPTVQYDAAQSDVDNKEKSSLKDELDNKTIEEIRAFANKVNKESNEKKVIVNDETDRHNNYAFNNPTTDTTSKVATSEEIKAAKALKKEYQTQYINELNKTIKEIDQHQDEMTSIDDIIVKPNEPKTILFKEQTPLVKNDSRIARNTDLKDTQWEKVKTFVKDFNTRSYAEVVGNVPGIIDVDNAIKVNLNELFYLNQNQLLKSQQFQETQFKDILNEYYHTLQTIQADKLQQAFDSINNQKAVELNKEKFINLQNAQNDENIKLLDKNIKLKEEIKELEAKLKQVRPSPVLEPKMSKLELEESLKTVTPSKNATTKKTTDATDELKKQLEAKQEIKRILGLINETNSLEAVINNQEILNFFKEESLAKEVIDELKKTNDDLNKQKDKLIAANEALDKQAMENTQASTINAIVDQKDENDDLKKNNTLANLSQNQDNFEKKTSVITNKTTDLSTSANQQNEKKLSTNEVNATNLDTNTQALNKNQKIATNLDSLIHNQEQLNKIFSNADINHEFANTFEQEAITNDIKKTNQLNEQLNNSNHKLNIKTTNQQNLMDELLKNNQKTSIDTNSSLSNINNQNLNNTKGFNHNQQQLNEIFNHADINHEFANTSEQAIINTDIKKANQAFNNQLNQNNTISKNITNENLDSKATSTEANINHHIFNNQSLDGLNQTLINTNSSLSNINNQNLNNTKGFNHNQQQLNEIFNHADINHEFANTSEQAIINTDIKKANQAFNSQLNQNNNLSINKYSNQQNLMNELTNNNSNQLRVTKKQNVSQFENDLMNKNSTNSSLNLKDLINKKNQKESLNNMNQAIANINSNQHDSNPNVLSINNEAFYAVNNHALKPQINNLQNYTNDQANFNNQISLNNPNNPYKIDQQTIDNLVPTTNKINTLNQQMEPYNAINNHKKTVFSKVDQNYNPFKIPNEQEAKRKILNNTLIKQNQYVHQSSQGYDEGIFNDAFGNQDIKININQLRQNAQEFKHGPITNENQKVMSLADACKIKRRPY